MKKSKVLLALACAVLLVGASIMGTLAYLTDSKTVTNTFTVGQVKIDLDEAPVDNDGHKTTGDRVKSNSYKLMPGHEYDKDPTVTVKAGSEESYVKMVVTVSKASALDTIFASHNDFTLASIVSGYNGTDWVLQGNGGEKDAATDTRSYTFYYKNTVSASTTDKALEALFTKITVPGSLTNEEIKSIEGMSITVKAYAIQKDGFTTADAAWAAFTK